MLPQQDGTNSFVKLLDEAEDRHGYNLMTSEWSKLYNLFCDSGAQNDPLMFYWCVSEYVDERDGGGEEKDYGRTALQSVKTPYWKAKLNALRAVANLYSPIMTPQTAEGSKHWPEYQSYVTMFKDPNIFNSFLSKDAYAAAFRCTSSPLGPQAYSSWIRRAPKAVKEGLEFCKDILIEGTYDATFKNAVANKSDVSEEGIFEFGALKVRHAELKSLIDVECKAAQSEHQQAKSTEAVPEEDGTKEMTPKEKAKATLDKHIDGLLQQRIFIFKRSQNAKDMQRALESSAVWRGHDTSATKRLWLSSPRIDNDFQTKVVTYERGDSVGKRLSKAPFSFNPSIDEEHHARVWELFKAMATTSDVGWFSDACSLAHRQKIMKAFPADTIWKLREDICVVYSEEESRGSETR